MRLPGEKTWSSGTCTGLVAPRGNLAVRKLLCSSWGKTLPMQLPSHFLPENQSTQILYNLIQRSTWVLSNQWMDSQSAEQCSPQYVPQSHSTEPQVLLEECHVQLSEQVTLSFQRSMCVHKAPSWIADDSQLRASPSY